MGMMLHRHLAEENPPKVEKPVEEKKEAATVKKPGRPKKNH
jgi:hypothetical protein